MELLNLVIEYILSLLIFLCLFCNDMKRDFSIFENSLKGNHDLILLFIFRIFENLNFKAFCQCVITRSKFTIGELPSSKQNLFFKHSLCVNEERMDRTLAQVFFLTLNFSFFLCLNAKVALKLCKKYRKVNVC